MICITCSKSWSGLNVSHCSACHETFSGVRLFDKHRVHYGERGRCVDPATVTDLYGKRIMWPDDNGTWRATEDYTAPIAPKQRSKA